MGEKEKGSDKLETNGKKKVIVGMSGGVDSSVAAILLMEKGYEVEGLFMRNWDSSINNDILGNPNLDHLICPQEEDYNDAKKVCEKLNIPLHRIDFIQEYWDDVFEYFLSELRQGRTPNPDIFCNKYIKFDAFVKEAKKLGADYIATGHYAKLEDGLLMRAKDESKDQTYFLSQVSKEQFKNVLFPLSDILKSEVRQIALQHDLITANKKDSTGICFIGERNFKNFLKNYLPSQKGKIVDIETKEVLGEHNGLMYYTIGQRRGLEIGGTKKRLFAVGKDLKKNILYVQEGEDNSYLYSDSCIVSNLNFNGDERPKECMAKFRYRDQDHPVTITYLSDNKICVHYQNGKAITPGQACVLYLETRCLGGGIIEEVQKNGKKLWYLL